MGASPHVAGYPRNCIALASFGAEGAREFVCAGIYLAGVSTFARPVLRALIGGFGLRHVYDTF
jgi:hypothetical protein